MKARAAGALLAILFPAIATGADLPVKSLTECIAIAFDNHPTLNAAGASVRAAEKRVWQSASGYLPQVNGFYDAERSKTSIGARTQTDAGDDSQISNFYNTGVTFSQVLFDFGRTLAAIRAAQASKRSVEADSDTQREIIRLGVKQTYYDLLAARRLRDVADATVRQTHKQLEEAEARSEVGLAPKFDVTRAQVQAANAELDQVTARNNVDVARESLRNALGLSGPLDFDIEDTLAVTPIEVAEPRAVEAAYANRPELRSLAEQEAALTQEIARLKRDYLPSITGGGGYNWAGAEYPLQDNWNVGASVNLSIFNGGLTTAQVGEAEARLAELEFNREAVKQDIALEVRRTALDLGRATESIGVAEKGVRQARENLELAEGRYRTGVGNIIEVTDAQASLTSAEASYVRTLYGYQISLALLERAVGQPIEEWNG